MYLVIEIFVLHIIFHKIISVNYHSDWTELFYTRSSHIFVHLSSEFLCWHDWKSNQEIAMAFGTPDFFGPNKSPLIFWNGVGPLGERSSIGGGIRICHLGWILMPDLVGSDPGYLGILTFHFMPIHCVVLQATALIPVNVVKLPQVCMLHVPLWLCPETKISAAFNIQPQLHLRPF